MIEAPPPALVMLAAAAALPFVRGLVRDAVLLAAPAAALALVWLAAPLAPLHWSGLEMRLFAPTAFGPLFATAFAGVALVGNIFALRRAGTLELSAASLYAGGAIGVASCGDFLSLFVFWELMAVGSTLIVFAGGTRAAGRAGMRYFILHVLSGALLMSGILGLLADTGDLALRPLAADSLHSWMILAGFLINAGAPPFSAWIADAYPEASPSGAVFLSAFTTKTAVFALITVFGGTTPLIFVGLYMVFYGIVYALFENDMRRILSYGIVNQVGVMLVAVGIGGPLALAGAAAHAFAHIGYKGLLMMSAGSVLAATGKRKCSELGGLCRAMPLTMAAAIIGGASIASAPLTASFAAKSLITKAALSEPWLWVALTAASAGAFLYAGIIVWFVFFQQTPAKRDVPEAPPPMLAAMALLSAMCIGLGLRPDLLYALLPYAPGYEPYYAAHVVFQMQLLAFAAAAFVAALPLLKRTTTISLDTDWFYRKGGAALNRATTAAATAAKQLTAAITRRLRRPIERALQEGDDLFAGRLHTGGMAATLIVLLAVLLVLYY